MRAAPLLNTILLATCLLACGGPDRGVVNSAPAPLLPPGAEGIDLSHHNGQIDWPLLSMSDRGFVYIKATEGERLTDPRFQENWREALRHGWQVGAYHFYLLCRSGTAQAENFIRQVEPRSDTLPPAADLEHAHNCAPTGPRAETLEELRTFLAALEAEYGQIPVIYTTPAFHAEWLAGEGFERHPLWIRSLSGPPDLPHAIWQYSMRGTLLGITGPVDLNRAAE